MGQVMRFLHDPDTQAFNLDVQTDQTGSVFWLQKPVPANWMIGLRLQMEGYFRPTELAISRTAPLCLSFSSAG